MSTENEFADKSQGSKDNWDEVKQQLASQGLDYIPIPYFFTIGAVTIAGLLKLDKDDIENSSTQGGFAGIVFGTYDLNKNNLQADATNGLIKVAIRLDLERKNLEAQYCNRRWNGDWRCSDWVKILDF